MTRPFLLTYLLLTGACAHAPGIPLPADLADRIEQAWNESVDANGNHLPDATGVLNGTRVLWADSYDFRLYCSAYPSEAAACATQGGEQHGVRVDAVPLIVIAPGVELDHRGEPIVHEAQHILSEALLHRPSPDVLDVGHRDERVWVDRGMPGTSQGMARMRVMEMDPGVLEGMKP